MQAILHFATDDGISDSPNCEHCTKATTTMPEILPGKKNAVQIALAKLKCYHGGGDNCDTNITDKPPAFGELVSLL